MLTRRKTVHSMGALTAGASAIIASGAFTQSSDFDRDASIDAVSDPNGIIALTPSPSSSIAQLSDDELTLDATSLGASGLNVGTVFEIGNTTNLNGGSQNDDDYAYQITNNLSGSATIDFAYEYTNGPSKAPDSLDFKAYTSDGDLEADWGPHNDVSGVSLGSGESLWVYIKIDTNGLTSADDLSGTLKHTVDQ